MTRNHIVGPLRLILFSTAIFVLPAVATAQRPPAADTNDQVRPVTRIQEPARPVLEQPHQPITGQTTGIPRQQPAPLIPSVDPVPNRPFTLASSVGTIDEDSADIVQLRNFTVTFLPAATGSVHARYNITAVDNISSFCPATTATVRARFRNTDNAGTLSQVSFEIHQTNITAGGNNIIYTFSSNGRGAGSAFTTATDTPAIDFDFSNNIYWIEATVFRSDPNQLADLGSIQIWESAGTACQ